MDFRILGPLEVTVGHRALELGGAKQRAVLAALVLRANEVVSVEQLIDDVWGERPPPSAAHSLEAYISRLRRLFAPHEPSLERRGRGYRLELADASLDLLVFEELIREAAAAAAPGDHARAAEQARDALSLWRGPALADVLLHAGARSEVERLEELRLRALDQRIDADLALGRHEEIVAELHVLVRGNPYRERFVVQLLIALYRSGRQAEALDVYEKTRRALADDLGLQPSAELQQLSGKIVRQDPELAEVAPLADRRPPPRVAKRHASRVVALLLAGVALVAAAVFAFFSTGSGSSDAAAAPRVALVLPRQPAAGREDTFVTPFLDGLFRAARDYDAKTTTFTLDQVDPDPEAVARIQRELRSGNFDLVIWAGLGRGAWELAPEVAKLPHTRFVYVDASLRGTPLQGKLNATGLPFADSEAGYLVGYLSGLVKARSGVRRGGNGVVSVVGGFPIPTVTPLVEGFARGVRQARPGTAVRVAYAGTFTDESICERIANRQIDQGSTIVFAAAGTCGFGALSAAGLRGVWAVGADADRSYLGSHILASTVKRYDRAVLLAVRWLVQGSLPAGKDVVLGLDDEAVGITGISPEVPPSIRRKLARLAAALREGEATRRN